MQRTAPAMGMALLTLALGGLQGAGAWNGTTWNERNGPVEDHPALIARVQQQGLQGVLSEAPSRNVPITPQVVDSRLTELLVRHRRVAGTVLLGELPGGDAAQGIDNRLWLVHNHSDPGREH